MTNLEDILKDLINRIKVLEKGVFIKKITIPTDGFFVVKQLSSDPSSPVEDEIWCNTTSHTVKIRLNGVTKTFTVS